MKVIYKQSILELISHEISIAEMNAKIISYIEFTEEEWEDLKREIKFHNLTRWFNCIGEPFKIYGIEVRKEQTNDNL